MLQTLVVILTNLVYQWPLFVCKNLVWMSQYFSILVCFYFSPKISNENGKIWKNRSVMVKIWPKFVIKGSLFFGYWYMYGCHTILCRGTSLPRLNLMCTPGVCGKWHISNFQDGGVVPKVNFFLCFHEYTIGQLSWWYLHIWIKEHY